MSLITALTIKGRPAEIAKILADTIDEKCKDDSAEDIREALNALLGVAELKRRKPQMTKRR